MALTNIGSITSKRDLAILGVFAVSFAALLLFQMNVWGVIVIAALFAGYLSWAATQFLVRQHTFNSRSITAWALPVGMAVFKVLLCLGLVWLVVGCIRRLFGFQLSG
jgi:flagellar biosynthesis protein FlhB